ncbi:MAG: YjbQ family protein [Lachnospiraceae bacterium]|nr:YjbQ family protein [Lachnospiraceae bacterium]GFI02384.1 hypothetical protein IMSAGC005_01213 [Lachnospiraceae bacterium]
MIQEICFSTVKEDLHDLTPEIRKVILDSGLREGVCVVYCPHTTAAIVVTSRMDPAGFEDLKEEVSRLVPTRIDFKHQVDTPTDASGHIKSAVMGISATFLIGEGDLLIGSSQGIYFMEFDGPRKRKVWVRITGE